MRRRWLPLVALAAAVGLIVLAAVPIASEREHEAAARDNALQSAALAEAAALDAYFARARDIVSVTARNPAFAEFYRDPSPRRTKIADPASTSDIRAALA